MREHHQYYHKEFVLEDATTLIVDFDSYGKAPLVENVSLDEMAERYRKAGI